MTLRAALRTLHGLNVLIIPDKFKGTLSAAAAAQAIAAGWRRSRPGDALELLPLGDGGDGFGELFGTLLEAKRRRVRTMDAAHRQCLAPWWWEPRTKTAVIESAAVIGLAMLPTAQFHPFELDSFGLGAVLAAAKAQGARRCLLGIGGSATNDGGFGLARAVGWQFLDKAGDTLERWTALGSLARLRAPRSRRWFDDLVVAVDVRNPLLGTRGSTRIYGPQKGLRPRDLPLAEDCLRRLAQVMKRERGRDFSRSPGAGAAGGLGFGLEAFFGARLEPGFDLFARQAGLARHLRRADLVITGEGAIDLSTLMGKGVGRIAERCRQLGLPCVGLAGRIRLGVAKRRLFTELHSLTDLAGVEAAIAQPARMLEQLAKVTAQRWRRER